MVVGVVRDAVVHIPWRLDALSCILATDALMRSLKQHAENDKDQLLKLISC